MSEEGYTFNFDNYKSYSVSTMYEKFLKIISKKNTIYV
jgi:hypothetical protein